jgi:hypothetical protein
MSATETATPTPAQAPGEFQEGRDVHGRFAPGNRGGPGNPYARQVAALRKEVVAFLAEGGNLRRLLAALLDRAVRGDNVAARMLMSYGPGKEVAPVHPDDVEAHEAAVFRAATARESDGTPVTGYPSGMWNQFVARMRPIVAEARHRELQVEWAALSREHDERAAAQAEHDRQAPPQPAEVEPPTVDELRSGAPRQAQGAGQDKTRPVAPPADNKRFRDVPLVNGHADGGPPECR